LLLYKHLLSVSGRLGLSMSPGVHPVSWFANHPQFGLADALSMMLKGTLKPDQLGMYIQYTNDTEAWGDGPSDFGRNGNAYFHGLDDGHSDILRVPLLQSPGRDSTDSSLYAGNRTTYLAMTGGEDGKDGLVQGSTVPFDRESSVVVGGGVVAMVDEDYTNDIVMTRGYVDEEERMTRPAAPLEVVLHWQIVLG